MNRLMVHEDMDRTVAFHQDPVTAKDVTAMTIMPTACQVTALTNVRAVVSIFGLWRIVSRSVASTGIFSPIDLYGKTREFSDLFCFVP